MVLSCIPIIRIPSTGLLHALRLDAYHPTGDDGTTPPLCEILSALCDEAVAAGIIEADSVVYRDLFDTELMGLLTPRPSIVIDEFRATLCRLARGGH